MTTTPTPPGTAPATAPAAATPDTPPARVENRDPLAAATAAASEALVNCYLRESPTPYFAKTTPTRQTQSGSGEGDAHATPTPSPTHSSSARGQRGEPVGGAEDPMPLRSVSGAAVGIGPEATGPAGSPGTTAERNDAASPSDPADVLVIPLQSRGKAEIHVEVAYRSATFRHRYRWPARLRVPDGQVSPLGFPALAGLLLEELAHGGPQAPMAAAPTALLARMLDSLHMVADTLRLRRDDVDRLWSPAPLRFIESEQALLLGHPTHPTPKSRGEMSPRDRATYSPELQGRFPLRWLAVVPELVRHASATGTPAPALVERMLRDDLGADAVELDDRLARLAPGERVLVPAHPWELDHLRAQPELADLFDGGGVVDLGPLGSPVTPTTSVRTVYQDGWPWQLKFSLHVRVTNSMRVTLPKELDRAVEAARLGRTEVGARAARIAPAFRFVHDPAYLTLARDGRVLDGFSVLLRESPWGARSTGNGSDAGAGAVRNVSAVTTLCQDHPFGGPSRLGRIVGELAARSGRRPSEVGRAWFARFCDVAVVSLVRLYLDLGLCFEPHQQNTLLELDEAGWPVRCAYRDSQGYFHRELAHADMCEVIPGLGEASESIFPEELADERLVYYPFMNLTLGVVNALGAAGCGDERVLLGDLRRCLEAERARGGRYPATLLDRLLDDERWPCKGNLRTRYHDMDELVGDIETQSVYVSVPNPLRGLAAPPPEAAGPPEAPAPAEAPSR